MAPESVVEQIRSLDPVSDCQRIVFLIKCSDFALDTTHALALALFRTYCVRSISRLLDRTGELRDRLQKRYDDADLIVSELREWGYASDRGRAAADAPDPRPVRDQQPGLPPCPLHCGIHAEDRVALENPLRSRAFWSDRRAQDTSLVRTHRRELPRMVRPNDYVLAAPLQPARVVRRVRRLAGPAGRPEPEGGAR
jgi:hypothetical protein